MPDQQIHNTTSSFFYVESIAPINSFKQKKLINHVELRPIDFNYD